MLLALAMPADAAITNFIGSLEAVVEAQAFNFDGSPLPASVDGTGTLFAQEGSLVADQVAASAQGFTFIDAQTIVPSFATADGSVSLFGSTTSGFFAASGGFGTRTSPVPGGSFPPRALGNVGLAFAFQTTTAYAYTLDFVYSGGASGNFFSSLFAGGSVGGSGPQTIVDQTGVLAAGTGATFNFFVSGDAGTSGEFSLQLSLTPVPVPAALPLCLGALGGIAGFGLRRRTIG